MDLSILIKLQDVDKRLMQLEEAKGDLPEKVQRLENELSGLKNELSQRQEELAQIQKDIRSNEAENDELYDKLIKYQEKIYSVKTNKEYDAITVEIETIEKLINENETSRSDLIDKANALKENIEQLEGKVETLEKELSEKKTALEKKMAQTEEEENRLNKKRQELVGQIDKQLLYNYDRIRNGKNGIALAEIENYTCSGCYTTIPAQTVVEVRRMDRVILCEMCGRILVTSNKKTKEEAMTSN